MRGERLHADRCPLIACRSGRVWSFWSSSLCAAAGADEPAPLRVFCCARPRPGRVDCNRLPHPKVRVQRAGGQGAGVVQPQVSALLVYGVLLPGTSCWASTRTASPPLHPTRLTHTQLTPNPAGHCGGRRPHPGTRCTRRTSATRSWCHGEMCTSALRLSSRRMGRQRQRQRLRQTHSHEAAVHLLLTFTQHHSCSQPALLQWRRLLNRGWTARPHLDIVDKRTRTISNQGAQAAGRSHHRQERHLPPLNGQTPREVSRPSTTRHPPASSGLTGASS